MADELDEELEAYDDGHPAMGPDEAARGPESDLQRLLWGRLEEARRRVVLHEMALRARRRRRHFAYCQRAFSRVFRKHRLSFLERTQVTDFSSCLDGTTQARDMGGIRAGFRITLTQAQALEVLLLHVGSLDPADRFFDGHGRLLFPKLPRRVKAIWSATEELAGLLHSYHFGPTGLPGMPPQHEVLRSLADLNGCKLPDYPEKGYPLHAARLYLPPVSPADLIAVIWLSACRSNSSRFLRHKSSRRSTDHLQQCHCGRAWLLRGRLQVNLLSSVRQQFA